MLGARRLLISRASVIPRSALRSFCRSAVAREVQLFDMPSMSPTMEEGGIVEWKVKQGDSFQAGDVLLEIETDKAEIAVEAADDGVLAKILVDAGTKGIKVGQPIAVTAEESDDLSKINYDELLSGASKQSAAAEPTEAPSSNTTAEQQQPSQEPAAAPRAPEPFHGNHGLEPLPAALRLIHEHHLSVSDIQGSGPFGRVTKGDVLAHLGKIPKDYPSKEQARFEKLEKMDLSKVEIAPPKSAESAANAGAEGSAGKSSAPPKPQPVVTTVSIPINAATVGKVANARKVALRAALLSLKPKPSVLRDPAFDRLTASAKPPFVVKTFAVRILRAKPVSLEVTVEEPPAPKQTKAVDTFCSVLQAELTILDE